MNDPFFLRRESTAELFLIRHGDAIPGPDEIIPSGIYDDLPLGSKGREQARALAERLSDTRFHAAYSSPLRRCRETAAPLIERLVLTLTIVEDIKEIRLGEVISLPVPKGDDDLKMLTEALRDRQLMIVRLAASTGSWDSIEGSEPSKAFRRRVVEAMNEIARQHLGECVLVFTHGGAINAYAAEVLGLEKDFFFPCANTSITVVRSSGDAHALFVLNDVAHLRLESK